MYIYSRRKRHGGDKNIFENMVQSEKKGVGFPVLEGQA